MLKLVDKNERYNDIVRLTGLAVQISGSVKLFNYLAIYQYDKSAGTIYNETNDLIK